MKAADRQLRSLMPNRCTRQGFVILFLWLGYNLPASGAVPDDTYVEPRNQMVDHDIVGAGIKDPRVIDSVRNTLRHEFLSRSHRDLAYLDMAVPIGEGQTISPPFIVAYMTEQLEPLKTDKVLEIGTGSGYQAAILSPLVKDVYTIEIVRPLGTRAAKTLTRLKYKNVHTRIGDGFQGWPDAAPFDKIVVTCSPEKVPQPLIDQLKDGGRMIVPLGERYQQRLYLFRKENGKLVQESLLPVLFVPMTGTAEDARQVKPDPKNPSIFNGGFEMLSGDPPTATGWHWQRLNKDVEDEKAPEGKRFMSFTNSEPGLGSVALQGLGIDGREVREVELSAWVRVNNAHPGPSAQQAADVALMFYDERRNPIGERSLGPWQGYSQWQHFSDKIAIPSLAREAIVRIGMFGGTGQLDLDDLQLKVTRRASAQAKAK